jgi:hypothetical protein
MAQSTVDDFDDLDLYRLFDEHKEDKLSQEHEMLRVMLQDAFNIIKRQRHENNLQRDKISNLNNIVISLVNKIRVDTPKSYTVPDNFEDSVDDDHLLSLFDDQDNDNLIS